MKITIELTEEQYQVILKLLPKTTYPSIEDFCLDQIETSLSIVEYSVSEESKGF